MMPFSVWWPNYGNQMGPAVSRPKTWLVRINASARRAVLLKDQRRERERVNRTQRITKKRIKQCAARSMNGGGTTKRRVTVLPKTFTSQYPFSSHMLRKDDDDSRCAGDPCMEINVLSLVGSTSLARCKSMYESRMSRWTRKDYFELNQFFCFRWIVFGGHSSCNE